MRERVVILLIYPWNNDWKITDKLNTIEPTIDFTYELENYTLPFLDILLTNN